jgi:putative Holliday junction resolvase
MRVLAIDYGTSKIGFAISDSTRTIASSLPYLDFTTTEKVADYINKLIEEKGLITQIIVGIPIDYGNNDKVNKTRLLVEEFVEHLKKLINIDVKTYNESFSTRISQSLFKGHDLKSSQIKKIKDSSSARVILQEYIDRR